MKLFLLDTLIRSFAFGLFALGVLWLVRRRSAAVRHAVAALSLFALLLIPVIRFAVPTLAVPLLPAPPVKIAALSPKIALPEFGTIGPVRPAVNRPVETNAIDPWVAIWAIGAVLFVGRYLFGFVTLCRWAKSGTPVEIDSLGVYAIESPSVSVPMTAWLGRHVILLPPNWESWSQDRRNSAIQHELAHVARHDWFTQIVSQLTCALMWPNPTSWMLCRQCRNLAEHAADDMVLASGTVSTTYAQDLLEIARETKATFFEPAVCMAQSTDVARRIEMILDTETQRGKVSLATLAVSGIGLALLAAPIACLAITRQAPIAPASHAVRTSVPAQIEISVKVVAKNTSFASVGLTPPMSAASKKTDKPSEATAFQLSDAAFKLLTEKLTEKHLVVSAPVLRTLDKQTGSIRTSLGEKDLEKIVMTPRVNADGSITVYFNMELGGAASTFTESIVYRGVSGSTMVIGKPGAPGKGGDLVAIVSARIIGDTTINPSPTP